MLDTGARSRMGQPPVPRATLGAGSPEVTPDQPRQEQRAAGKDGASQGTLILQPVAVSAGKGRGRQG